MDKRNKEEISELLAEVTDGKYAELKATNERLLKKIDRLKDKNADVIEAVYHGIKDGIQSLDLPPVKAPPKSRKTSGEEICVPLLSDIQLAKTTPDYDTATAEERVVRYAHKISELARLQRHSHPVKKCAVLALGDIVEGELIFPGQSHMIDASLYRQVTVD